MKTTEMLKAEKLFVSLNHLSGWCKSKKKKTKFTEAVNVVCPEVCNVVEVKLKGKRKTWCENVCYDEEKRRKTGGGQRKADLSAMRGQQQLR